jgi:hypothetical protein
MFGNCYDLNEQPSIANDLAHNFVQKNPLRLPEEDGKRRGGEQNYR